MNFSLHFSYFAKLYSQDMTLLMKLHNVHESTAWGTAGLGYITGDWKGNK